MFKRLLKRWRERCRPVRLLSSELPTAQMAQSYLFWLSRRYGECPKCGTLSCFNSPKYPAPLDIEAQRMEYFRMMCRALSMPAKLMHAALEPSSEADAIKESVLGKHDNSDLNQMLDEIAERK